MTELTDRQVGEITAACDEAAVLLDELRARDPSIRSSPERVQEWSSIVAIVRHAFQAAGLDEVHASRAATVWVIQRADPRYCVRGAFRPGWRQPGDGPGGLGQRETTGQVPT